MIFSPFLKELSQEELKRCAEICDWWRETQAKVGIDVDAGDVKVPVQEGRQRVHRLLKDVHSQTYLNCTIEVRRFPVHGCDT